MTEKTMTLQTFVALSEAYGGDLERWPAERRAEAEALLAGSAEAAAALAEAEALDRMLDGLTAPAPSAALTARVLEAAAAESAARAASPARSGPARRRAEPAWSRLFAQLGLGSSALVAGGLGVAAMAGLAVGVIAPVSTASTDQGVYETAALDGAVDPDALDEEELELLEMALVDELFDDDFDASL